MFGFVCANIEELTQEQKDRYTSFYCGICRQIHTRFSNTARLSLRYDMAFLALLLSSLYEPADQTGRKPCHLHPIKPRPWADNEFIRYSADMNVALAYFSCLDNWNDDRSLASKAMAGLLKPHCEKLKKQYPRQWQAIEEGIAQLSRLEKENCPGIDEPAGCFGRLMAELMVYEEDLWAPYLRQVGLYLGRFIYLADAVADYDRDKRRKKYNPLLSMEKDPKGWEDILVMTLGKATESYEKLPLVQDKPLLDNILYSGVWTNLKKTKAGETP